MHNSIHIEIQCTGDPITAIGETLKVVKAYGKPLPLIFGSYTIIIRPTSDLQDLIEIHLMKSRK